MSNFTEGKGKILVASDLLNRGIDIPSVNAVVNYDLPYDVPTYLHRIGRSGRFGLLAVAVTLVLENERAGLTNLESMLGSKIEPLPKYVSGG